MMVVVVSGTCACTRVGSRDKWAMWSLLHRLAVSMVVEVCWWNCKGDFE